MKTINDIRAELDSRKDRSAWNKGVTLYAFDLLDDLEESLKYYPTPETRTELHDLMLNGAANWNQYSWGGCSLCYDCDIAERLCTPSELKRTDNGNRRPNSREEWLDVQTRALCKAANRIKDIAFKR